MLSSRFGLHDQARGKEISISMIPDTRVIVVP
jgi:hypothetical protein